MPDESQDRPMWLPPQVIALRLASAYQASQAVYVATALSVPELLREGARTSSEIAQATGTQADRMHRLLRALAALNVVKDLGSGSFELTPVGDCLRPGVSHSVYPNVLMIGSDNWRQSFASLAECIRTGKNAFEILHGVEGPFPYLAKHPELARIFDDAMSAISTFTGPAAARAYDFAGVSRVVDVGGGHGRILASILKAHPHLCGTLFDVARVVEGAPAFLAGEGVADRCEVVGGDMFASVPAGGDLYLLSHVIHDWDDEQARKVLHACRRAMAPEAKVLILDRVLPDRVEPDPRVAGDILFDLMMMVWTGGRERTASEFQTLLDSAAFRLERVIAMPTLPDSLVEATPA